MVEGEKSVVELIHSDYKVEAIFASADWVAGNQSLLTDLAVFEGTNTDLERMSFFKSASPVIAVAYQPTTVSSSSSDWALVLDDIKDPGNLGTIIRIADWYGINSIYCSEETVDVYNPKTISSSMGSFARVNIVYDDIIQVIKNANKKVFYTLMEGESLYDIPKQSSGLIVIGGEANGISTKLLGLEHTAVTIPRTGLAESLNAGVATAIVCDRLLR